MWQQSHDQDFQSYKTCWLKPTSGKPFGVGRFSLKPALFLVIYRKFRKYLYRFTSVWIRNQNNSAEIAILFANNCAPNCNQNFTTNLSTCRCAGQVHILLEPGLVLTVFKLCVISGHLIITQTVDYFNTSKCGHGWIEYHNVNWRTSVSKKWAARFFSDKNLKRSLASVRPPSCYTVTSMPVTLFHIKNKVESTKTQWNDCENLIMVKLSWI